MKTKKSQTKLTINKLTVSNLNENEQKSIKAGVLSTLPYLACEQKPTTTTYDR